MAMTLEQRIKALMEGTKDEDTLSEETIGTLDEGKETIKTKGGTTITDEDSKDDKTSKKDDSEDDSEDEDGDDDSSDDSDADDGQFGSSGDSDDSGDEGDTDVSKDLGKKNKVDVKEGLDPFGKLDKNGAEESGSAKTGKLKAKLSNADPKPGKLATPPQSGATDDNGDNARLKVGLGKKETNGKLTGPSAGGSQNPDQARNEVDKNPQGAGPKGLTTNEHIDALFNGEELSEEFRTKATTIFEAAVASAAEAEVEALAEEYAQEIVRIQEETEQQMNEAVEEVKNELVEQVDGFLNYVVEQWVADNQIALESGMKVELVNGFIDGLKDLFKEHYVDIPEDKLDLIEEQNAEIESLTAVASTLEEQNAGLQADLVALQSALVMEEVTSDLTEMQREKFEELVNAVEFTTSDEYAEKLTTLKENYFPKGKPANTPPTLTEAAPTGADDHVSKYVAAIGQKIRF
jgi:hypothetical protein